MASRVEIVGKPAVPTDRSGTITAGGVAQVLMALNNDRTGFWLQNLSAGDLYILAGGTALAGQPCLLIPSGALYEAPLNGVPVAAISIYGATTAQAFSAREW